MGEGFNTIVVGVDFSDASTNAWAAACRLAAQTNSQVHLVHVTPDPLNQSWNFEGMTLDFEAISDELRKQAHERLAAITPQAGLGEDRITRVVLTGVAHSTLTDYAAAKHADLIVVGTHGYGPIKHMLLGSVAERVVRQAPCPVMTVPQRSSAGQH